MLVVWYYVVNLVFIGCLTCLLWFTDIAWSLGLILVYCLLGDFALLYCLIWYCCCLDLNC